MKELYAWSKSEKKNGADSERAAHGRFVLRFYFCKAAQTDEKQNIGQTGNAQSRGRYLRRRQRRYHRRNNANGDYRILYYVKQNSETTICHAQERRDGKTGEDDGDDGKNGEIAEDGIERDGRKRGKRDRQYEYV